MKKLNLIIIILLGLCSCQKKEDLDCESLSMKKFRGFPKSSHLFEKHCSSEVLHYSEERCKGALNQLILGSNEEKLKKDFGERVMECFNQSDINNFLKK